MLFGGNDTFLTGEWRYLGVISYYVDPEILEPYLPANTEVDLYHERAVISFVGFMFLNARVKGLAVPFHKNFPEFNLRFYVKTISGCDLKRGVVFIKEFCPRPIVAFVARLCYREDFISLPMRCSIDEIGGELIDCGSVRYEWLFNSRWNHVELKTIGEKLDPQHESLEDFIIERYWGYGHWSPENSLEFHVEHRPWRYWNTSEYSFDCDFEELYGKNFGPAISAGPASAIVVDGSPIRLSKGHMSNAA